MISPVPGLCHQSMQLLLQQEKIDNVHAASNLKEEEEIHYVHTASKGL